MDRVAVLWKIPTARTPSYLKGHAPSRFAHGPEHSKLLISEIASRMIPFIRSVFLPAVRTRHVAVRLGLGRFTHNMRAPPPDLVSVANKELVRLVKESPTSGWDDAWKIGLTPWDSGDVQPALRDLILSNQFDFPKVGRALVPGCGRGYDATFIASHLGLDTLAVDISSTAVLAANDLLRETTFETSSTKVSFEVADFFKFSLPEGQQFDLIYDHTFFVAIPPVLRSDWGERVSALLKPGGHLIILVFPLNLAPDEDGPPFFVKPEHYDDVLGKGWDKVLDKVPENSHPRRVGRERLVVYRKL